MGEENDSLATACMEGDLEKSCSILEKSPDMAQTNLTWKDSDGKELSSPPIFIAIDYGHLQMVEKFLPYYNSTIDSIKDEEGDYTPLQWASWTGNLDIVNLIIDQGKAKVDEEALSLAREFKHANVAEVLSEYVDLYSTLQGDDDAIMDKACREGDVAMVRKLMEEQNYNLDKWKDEGGKYLALSPMYMALVGTCIILPSLFFNFLFVKVLLYDVSLTTFFFSLSCYIEIWSHGSRTALCRKGSSDRYGRINMLKAG